MMVGGKCEVKSLLTLGFWGTLPNSEATIMVSVNTQII